MLLQGSRQFPRLEPAIPVAPFCFFKPDFCLVNSWTDREGQFVQGEFAKNDATFRTAWVYTPNRNPEREIFYSYIEDMVDPARPTILCGDFNAVFNRTTDRRGSNLHDSCQALRTLFSNCCVTDIWLRLHPTEGGFSWCEWDGSVASRIDLIGCPTSWLTHALSCTLLPCPFCVSGGVKHENLIYQRS